MNKYNIFCKVVFSFLLMRGEIENDIKFIYGFVFDGELNFVDIYL